MQVLRTAGLDPADLDRSSALVQAWAIEHYGPDSTVEDLRPMPGHAGISFGFDVVAGGRRDPLVVRVPPRGVRRQGNTDVLRQVPVLQAAQAEGVPVAPVRWWSADERWFGSPFFMVERLAGSSVDSWEPADVERSASRSLFRQAIEALVAIHRVRWRTLLPDWSQPRTLDEEIRAWEPILVKGENPEWISRGLKLRDALLAHRPPEPDPGLVHGDFYSNNWVWDGGRLLAVVDWEISAIGPSLLDIGWLCMMYDQESWGPTRHAVMGWSPCPDEIAALYQEISGSPVPDLGWYRALAAWRLGSITALNYRLHRDGRRPDETWELLAEAFIPMIDQAHRLLPRTAAH
jgi:aminoglycoside phosphotransferase (APT) family kinase protein